MTALDGVIAAARTILAERYPHASVAFAAGSLVRGEGTRYSDIDLVVVYASLDCASRESFVFGDYPVEAFIHDPETLEYFFLEVDRASGVPTLPQMVSEGIEIPGANELSRALKARAAEVLAMGPPALDAASEQKLRYFVSDLLDDLRAPRSREELVATACRLYDDLANYYLRSRGQWSAKSKTIPRTLKRLDPHLHDRYGESFDRLFVDGDPAPVLALAEELLAPQGGLLFDGYRSDAPADWRRGE